MVAFSRSQYHSSEHYGPDSVATIHPEDALTVSLPEWVEAGDKPWLLRPCHRSQLGNPERNLAWMRVNRRLIYVLDLDLDYLGAVAVVLENAGVRPLCVIINPQSGHGHLQYLVAPIDTRSPAAMTAWHVILAMLQREYRADQRHHSRGAIVNPLSPEWDTRWVEPRVWTVAELLEHVIDPADRPTLGPLTIEDVHDWAVRLDWRPPVPTGRAATNAGRNDAMFHGARRFAYRLVAGARQSGDWDGFAARIRHRCHEINARNQVPLPACAEEATASSVARWCRYNYRPSYGAEGRRRAAETRAAQTARRRESIKLLASRGLPVAAIASELSISIHTVYRHLCPDPPANPSVPSSL